MPIWAIILVVVLLVGVMLWVCFSMSDTNDQVEFKSVERHGNRYTRTISYEGTIPCYLCLRKVRNSEWDSGEHRKHCAFNNQRELLSFPTPYESYCPNCSEKLRLWPAKGHPFYCDECPFNERSVLKRSTGHNRLNCFLCDFDCCANCSNKEKFQKVCSEPRQLVDEKIGISDEDIERMAAGMAVMKMLEKDLDLDQPYATPQTIKYAATDSDHDAFHNREKSAIPHAVVESSMIDTRDGQGFENVNEKPSSSNPYPFNQNIFNTTNTPAPTVQQGINTSPFIMPQHNTQQGFASPHYMSSYNIPTTSTPNINQTAPSSNSSLPYAISPYPQPNQLLASSNTEFVPSAPPFIQQYL